MRAELIHKPASVAKSESVTAAEWQGFHKDCISVMSLGGERGAIAERMLNIGERIRALSSKVDDAVKRYCI